MLVHCLLCLDASAECWTEFVYFPYISHCNHNFCYYMHLSHTFNLCYFVTHYSMLWKSYHILQLLHGVKSISLDKASNLIVHHMSLEHHEVFNLLRFNHLDILRAHNRSLKIGVELCTMVNSVQRHMI